MFLNLFNNVTNEEKTLAVKNLFEKSSPNGDFFLLILLSVLMATLGLLTNSVAVIVGSMLIAPILYPILGLAMGIIMSDSSLVSKSFITIAKASVLGIIVSAMTTLIFSSQTNGLTSEILSRTDTSLLSIVIAAVAGLAASFALVKPKLSETLPGVAISVSLIPPLSVIGIGMAKLNSAIFLDSLLYFLVNIAGIIFTSIIVFSMMNFYVKRGLASNIVKKEEEKIKTEKELEKEKKTIN